MHRLILFFDGSCPLCVKEMAMLGKKDTSKHIYKVDIHSQAMSNYPNIEPEKASNILHAIDQDGKLLLGLDAIHAAWRLVGRGWLYAPLRWWLIKPIADLCYIYFANNRYRFSYLLTGTSQCSLPGTNSSSSNTTENSKSAGKDYIDNNTF